MRGIPCPVIMVGKYFELDLHPFEMHGCEILDTVKVQFNIKAYIPNAFIPNSNDNNIFRPYLSEIGLSSYDFRIFDRWGDLVFHEDKDPEKGWNGQYKGKNSPCPSGVYVYIIQVTTLICPKTLIKGDVTLISK
ncbi:MAG: gliding motility-associated C-terminal domain-containing protein [Saprospiraceae bacterium]|nr:gliding motility-associated C-terminal domain-containing protein [Saprospiraceae bacterium]